jgi:hypothetical protein
VGRGTNAVRRAGDGGGGEGEQECGGEKEGDDGFALHGLNLREGAGRSEAVSGTTPAGRRLEAPTMAPSLRHSVAERHAGVAENSGAREPARPISAVRGLSSAEEIL